MRIAVFSDVHGNLRALERVLAAVRAERPDKLIFCGDICGYYYQQNEVISALSGLDKLTCVAGNHDRLFLACREDPRLLDGCVRRYGNSYARLLDGVSDQSLRFLRSLPDSYTDQATGVAAFHGSPWSPLDEYIYPTDPVDRFAELPHRFIFLGHTHHPMHRTAGAVQVINPGSCGQPRDHNLAGFALVDLDSGAVEFRRVRYDVEALLDDVRRLDPEHPYLADVLMRKGAPA